MLQYLEQKVKTKQGPNTIVFTHTAMQKEKQRFDLYLVYCFLRAWQPLVRLHTN